MAPGGEAERVTNAGEVPTYRNLRQLSRALSVLETIALRPMRPAEVAQRLGLPWTTVYRTISQLSTQGFLHRDQNSGHYTIGPRMWFIGTSYLTNHRVLHAAQPHLETLANSIDATVQLCERSGRLAVALFSHHRTQSEIITKTTYGYHFPLHCGAKAQVLLAYEDPEFTDWFLSQPLERLTADTITDAEELRDRLALIRKQGYAVTRGDVQEFTGSVAAPVLDGDGRIRASICIILRRSRLNDPDETDRLIELVLSTAKTISFSLGWRPGVADAQAGQAYPEG